MGIDRIGNSYQFTYGCLYVTSSSRFILLRNRASVGDINANMSTMTERLFCGLRASH